MFEAPDLIVCSIKEHFDLPGFKVYSNKCMHTSEKGLASSGLF